MSATQEELLCRAFADSGEIFVEQAFHSGYSGASAYLISREGRAPVVAKMAHPFDIEREYEAYHAFVAERVPQHTTHLQGDMLRSGDETLGLLTYTFAGGDPQMRTTNLAVYYQTRGAVATAAVINRLFRLYGRQWWANHQLKRLVMGEVYDRLLPVHLQLTLPPSPLAADCLLLQSHALDLAQLRRLQPGQNVRLNGFRVVKIRSGLLTLEGKPPPGVRAAPIRVRVEGNLPTTYQLGEVVDSQLGCVKATRIMLLREAAQQTLPNSDLTRTTFTYGVHTFSNPLHQLDRLLDYRYDAKVSITHGDLNLQNILVDPATDFAWLIDFCETCHNPVLFDLQRLEVQVLTKLLPLCLHPRKLDATCVVTLLESLHTLFPDERSPLPALQAPYTILVTLRQLMVQYLVDNREWAEYYRGLALVLMGALKYDELDPVARKLAFLAASTVLRLVAVPLSAQTVPVRSPSPAKSRMRWGIIWAVVLALSLILTVLMTNRGVSFLKSAPTTLPRGEIRALQADVTATPSSIFPSVAISQNVNIRKGPGTVGYPIIAISRGTEVVKVTGKDSSGEWLQIEYDGTLAWVFARFVTPILADSIDNVPIIGIPSANIPTPEPPTLEQPISELPTPVPTASALPTATFTPEALATATPSMQRLPEQGTFLARHRSSFVLDAQFDDWPGQWRSMSSIIFGSESFSGLTDLGARFQLAWSVDGLYLALDVQDDRFRAGPDGADMWKGDCVELQLDRNLSADYAHSVANEDDFQIGISYDVNLSQLRLYRWLPFNVAGVVAAQGVVIQNEEGYVLEMLIPWSLFEIDGYTVQAGQAYGFNLSVNDNDSDEVIRETQLSASPSRTVHDNPTEWGTLVIE